MERKRRKVTAIAKRDKAQFSARLFLILSDACGQMDWREGWRVARLIPGTGRGPRRRRYTAPNAEGSNATQWADFLTTRDRGGNGCCIAG